MFQSEIIVWDSGIAWDSFYFKLLSAAFWIWICEKPSSDTVVRRRVSGSLQLYYKETPTQVLSCEYCKSFKNSCTLFYKQRLFLTHPQRCLTFSLIELQMLFRCCLIHLSIIIQRHFFLGLSMSYLCDQFFMFMFIFVIIKRIISWTQTHLFFCLFFRIWPIIFGW